LVFIDEREDSLDDGYFAIQTSPRSWQNCPAFWHAVGDVLSFADAHAEHWRWLEPTTPAAKFPYGVVKSPGDRDFDRVAAAYASVMKMVAFDEALAIDTYIAANLETLGRHQQAIRELSTPVIRVHAGILLLPLVGAVDSVRAQQIMESVLVGVVQEQAKCVIIDIAGVPVVDTKVADNLIKTTTAVSLLGAKTILTGISAQIARTIVQLGVDISVMQTKSKLADGIVLALELAGKQIVEKH